MTIRYSKNFVKQLSKQPPNIQRAFYARLEIFADNPHEPLLRNHALSGKLKGFYSINVTGDVRALYEIVDDTIYIYQMIGSHSQLYR
jgi:addiction module RelE/StbE family toxin